jgi:DNA-binding IclR family transcriptional regulator
MAAGLAEIMTPDGDGDEERGVATAEMYANASGLVDYEAASDPAESTLLDQSYVDRGLMELQQYANISTAAIYEHVRTIRESGQSVFDKERTAPQRAKSLPVGRTATRIVYAGLAGTHIQNSGAETLPENWLG